MKESRDLESQLAGAFPVAVAGLGCYLTLAIMAWLTGQLGGWLWHHRWPAASLTAHGERVLWNLIRDPGHPSLAWPNAAQPDILPAPEFYLVGLPLLLAVAGPAGLAAARQLPGWGRPGWAHTNPRRVGFSSGEALRLPGTPHRCLRSWGPSYDAWLGFEPDLLGRLRPLRGAGDRQTAGVIGPPGRGKTLGLVVPNLLAWPGAAVATSTKTDVASLTGAVRQGVAASRGGGVYLLDWPDLVGPELRLRTVSWDPLDGCRDSRVVSNRVAALLGAVEAPHSRDSDDQFWKQGATLILHAYLHAAALADRGIVQVLEWLDQHELYEPGRIIESVNPVAGIWGERLQGMGRSPQITIGGFFETAKSCFAALQEPIVLANCSRSDFDVERFLETASTLFVVDPAGEARVSPSAPLTAALLDWIADRAYRRARELPGRICEPRLGLFLDELPNIAPLHSLGRHLSQGASQGVHIAFWSAQTYGQLAARYGEREAENVWTLTRYALVFGGSRDVEWLERISRLAGEYEDREKTTSRSRGEPTVSEQPVRRPVLPVESLVRIPRGQAVLLAEGRVVRVLTPPLHLGLRGSLGRLARRLGPPAPPPSSVSKPEPLEPEEIKAAS